MATYSKMKKSTFLIFILLLLAGAVTAAIYKWVDEEGKVHYGDRPTLEHEVEQIEIEQGPSEEEIQKSRERIERLIGNQKRREDPQEVLGTAVIGFAPTVLAVMPEPPIEITLIIKPIAGGSPIKHRITDTASAWEVVDGKKPTTAASHQNFMLSLRPGVYEISEMLIKSNSLSEKPLSLALNVPSFTVPEGNCVYIGRFGYIYIRLPPGSYEQTQAVARLMAKERGIGKSVATLYLAKGSLIPDSFFIDQPTEAEQTHGYKNLSEARKKQCVTSLVKFK